MSVGGQCWCVVALLAWRCDLCLAALLRIVARFSSEPQLRQIDLRKAQRKRVMLSAHCRTNTGRSGDVVIVDLTGDGCCMFTKALAVSVGLRVRVRPHGLESLPGVVRWVAKGYAGIEFDRPLYGPIADHLQRAFSAY